MVTTAIRCRCPCHHLLSQLLPRFAISAPMTIHYRRPYCCFLLQSLPLFTVIVSITFRYCRPCCHSLSVAPTVCNRCPCRHLLSLHGHHFLLWLLSQPLSPFAVAVPVVCGLGCCGSLLLSLLPFAVAIPLLFPAMASTTICGHGLYHHLLSLSLSSFAVAVTATVHCCHPCHHLLSLL